MGSCFSLQDSDHEHETQRRVNEIPRPIVFNTAIIASRELRSDHLPNRGHHHQVPPHSLYGEYTCENCGRFWKSTLSWHKSYQVCIRCRRNVYPKSQREVRPSDIKQGNGPEHPKELCQKCQQLGTYCGSRNKSASGNHSSYYRSAASSRSYCRNGNSGRVQVRSRQKRY